MRVWTVLFLFGMLRLGSACVVTEECAEGAERTSDGSRCFFPTGAEAAAIEAAESDEEALLDPYELDEWVPEGGAAAGGFEDEGQGQGAYEDENPDEYEGQAEYE